MALRKIIILVFSTLFVASNLSLASAVVKPGTAKGPKGQILSVTPALGLADMQEVTVTGSKYEKNVGIYVAYCEIPKPGIKPDHCYGGININGSSKGSIWITSNKPWYVPASVVKKFGTNGSFKVKVMVAKMIDATDCTVVKCGIITRADHTRGDYRKADVLVPVRFK